MNDAGRAVHQPNFEPKPLKNEPIQTKTDLGMYLANNACIKLWLPEKLTEALNELSVRYNMSRPEVLRWLLFMHMHGRVAYEQFMDWKRREGTRLQVQQTPMFSPARSSAPRTVTAMVLGKSVDDFKWWLPEVLKSDLTVLAQAENMGLSDYIRKTLVRLFLGEGFHHRWQAAIGNLPPEVVAFEDDRNV